VEEEFGGVLGVLAELLQVSASFESSIPRSNTRRDMPEWRLAGSVLTAVITRSALIPFVMKVLEPLTM